MFCCVDYNLYQSEGYAAIRMNVHDPYRVEREKKKGWDGISTISLSAQIQSQFDRPGVRAILHFDILSLSHPRRDHTILDHAIPLLDTLGYGREWKDG